MTKKQLFKNISIEDFDKLLLDNIDEDNNLNVDEVLKLLNIKRWVLLHMLLYSKHMFYSAPNKLKIIKEK